VDAVFIATSTVTGGGGVGAQLWSQLRERKDLGLQFILEISKPGLFLFPFFCV